MRSLLDMQKVAAKAGFRLGLALLALGWAGVARAQSLPDGFALETVVGEPFVSYPVGFAFLPDGRILILEKETGNVRLSAVGSGTSTIIANIPGVAPENERGLLGIAIDPGWPERPFVYLMATYADGKTRVTMHRADGDLTQPTSTSLTLGGAYVLLDYILNIYQNHKGGTLRFGPDHLLYVSTGDDGGYCEALDVNAYNGKILRIDVAGMPGPGSGPPPMSAITPANNPFPGPTDNARLVFARGFRNPFRFTIDPLQGNLYIGDVGAHAWEEVDELVQSGYTGLNFGWPYWEGNHFICQCCDSLPAYTFPIYEYPHQGLFPAAVIAGPVYRRVSGSPASFPFEYEGNLFVHDHYSGWIRRIVRTRDAWELGAPVAGQPDPTNWATGMGYISDMQVGPDGALYIMVLVGVPGVDRGLHRIVDTSTTDVMPDADRLASMAVPNPGRVTRGVAIRFGPGSLEGARLQIYDAAGRWVRSLVPGRNAAAELFWDGRTSSGQVVPPGLYVYELETGSGVAARGKISLIR